MTRAVRIGLAVALMLGCGGKGPALEQPSRFPGASTTYQVTSVFARGPYLDAVIEREGSNLRLFFPASDACRRVVRVEAVVEYKATSVPGKVKNAQEECDSVGIGSLRFWRDRRPRQSKQVIPRGRAEFRRVYQDSELTLVRGRFPYANQVGWAGGWDTLAALPRNAACDALVARGSASLEFRHAGPEPYRLVTGEGRCTIEAFLRPLPGDTAGTDSESEP
jgi:hypothetical protein